MYMCIVFNKLLTGLPIRCSVIVALAGLLIGYSVRVALLTGMIVTVADLLVAYNVIIASSSL